MIAYLSLYLPDVVVTGLGTGDIDSSIASSVFTESNFASFSSLGSAETKFV